MRQINGLWAVLVILTTMSFNAFSEGVADRKNEQDRHTYDASMVIQQIHATHGPTAAGGQGDMMSHTGSDIPPALNPQYRSLKSSHEYRDLSGHEYKRRVFGSNR